MAIKLPTSTLVVDVNNRLRMSQASILQEAGYGEVLQASNGTDAWAMVKNQNPDLIVSAWQLEKEMSGLGLLKVIRGDATKAETPFVLVVEEITKKQVIEASASGVSAIILRPYNRDTFIKKVEKAYNPVLDPKSKESQKLYQSGLAQMKHGQYEEAVQTFKKIIEVNENAEIYYNLGYIKTTQGRYEEAIMAFRKATELDQTYAKAYQRMGEAYAKLGRELDARDCLEQAAKIYMNKNMDEHAEQAFLQVLQVNPNTPNIYNSLGIVYRRQGKYNESIDMYRKALKVNPEDEHIQYNLARVYMNVQKFKEAAEVLRKAIKINPDFFEAQNLLESIIIGEGLS